MDKNSKNKQLAIRFLKETSLITYWKDYIFEEEPYNLDYWEDKTDILHIFGNTNFTSFVFKKKGIRFDFHYFKFPPVYAIFAKWLDLNDLVQYCDKKTFLVQTLEMYKTNIKRYILINEKTKKLEILWPK